MFTVKKILYPTDFSSYSNQAYFHAICMADKHNASLIVLGSHGRSGLTGLVVGSVAAAVAAHSRRSVLIVHRHAG